MVSSFVFCCDISIRDSGCAAGDSGCAAGDGGCAADESPPEMAATLPSLQQVGAHICME